MILPRWRRPPIESEWFRWNIYELQPWDPEVNGALSFLRVTGVSLVQEVANNADEWVRRGKSLLWLPWKASSVNQFLEVVGRNRRSFVVKADGQADSCTEGMPGQGVSAQRRVDTFPLPIPPSFRSRRSLFAGWPSKCSPWSRRGRWRG